MIKKSMQRAVLIYGVVIAILGYIGYHESQSKASLWSGLGSGLILVLSSLVMPSRRNLGIYTSLAVTTLLTIIFCYRYGITQGTLPAILAIISGGMLVYLSVQTVKWRK